MQVGTHGAQPSAAPQRLDSTGLLYYHARYYDPVLARFVSADTVVPGDAAGGMDGVALRPLTVGFHEPSFIGQLTDENRRGFWFQLSDDERQQAGSPWGPASPQALNRYSYVQNNPVRWTDPTGHGQAPYEKNGGGAAGGGGGGGGIKLPSPRGLLVAIGRFLKGLFVGASADGDPTNEALKLKAALDYALKPNNLNHIFGKPRHGLDVLVQKYGSEANVMQEVIGNLGKLPADGKFEVIRNIGGFDVTISRGAVVDGVAKIGTMFIVK